jgi:RNA polymerase sigma-70 factor (ECF subfamily)
MKPEQIEILVLDVQQGKVQSLELLYKHFIVPMRRFTLIRVKDSMVAEDLVQNVWLKIASRVGRLKDVSLFRSWLYRALRWEIVDWARQNQRTVALEDSEIINDSGSSDDNDVLDIAPLLKHLSTDERDVIELYYLSDLSLRETALTLLVPEGTVKSRLSRARKKLQTQYQTKGDI